MKKIRYIFETIIVVIFLVIFKCLGVRLSRSLGGLIARKIGIHLKVNKIARRNIERALPDLTVSEVDNILLEMWNNLGGVVSQIIHLKKFKGDFFYQNVTIKGQKYLQQAMAKNKGVIIVGGHLGNWEIGPVALKEMGYESLLIYRKANNPYVDKIIQKQRNFASKSMVSKGSFAAKEIVANLKNKGIIGLLVDQKMNNGIAVPFFAHDAMTAPAAADLAIKYGCPLVPARVICQEDGRYVVEFYPEIEMTDKSSLQIMTQINRLFEQWIRQYPSQWFWVHNRWPKS